MADTSPLLSDKLTLIVAGVICLIWAAAMMVSFINPKFNPPEGVNIAFGAVTGYIFNRQIRKDTP